MNINIQAFLEQFEKEYDLLYETPGYICGYDEAVEAFDEFLSKQPEFIGEFARYRGDCISSDREAAAFMFALSTFA